MTFEVGEIRNQILEGELKEEDVESGKISKDSGEHTKFSFVRSIAKHCEESSRGD